MKALIQRVNRAKIKINDQVHAEIGAGLLAFIGIEKSDDTAAADRLVEKLLSYRIFSDTAGKMNLDLQSVKGDLMLVSQFTLVADTTSGRRPSFSSAMPPKEAEVLFSYLLQSAKNRYHSVKSGVFAADMKIELENDGPVTFLLQA